MKPFCSVCPRGYIKLSKVECIINWFTAFAMRLHDEGLDSAIMHADCLCNSASSLLFIRCGQFQSVNMYIREERLALGSLENVRSDIIEAARKIPFELVRAIAEEECRLRLEPNIYESGITISIEENIAMQAIYNIIKKTPAKNEVTLYRVASRMHAKDLQRVFFVTNDKTIKSQLYPGDVIPLNSSLVDRSGKHVDIGVSAKEVYLLVSQS